MAKRFTDTDKWKKSFFSDLPTEAKLTWIYLLDNCDHTGVWSVNLKLLKFQIGFKVTIEKLNNWFSSKIHFLSPDKIFIKSFIDFQYGVLNENNNAHKQVIKLLEKIGPPELLISPSLGAQDKDKDKDQDKDQDKEEKRAADFYDILNPVQVLDISLKHQQTFDEVKSIFLGPNVFDGKLPVQMRKVFPKFCATLVSVYENNIDDFKEQLTSIINEKNTEEKTGASRAAYIQARIKNETLRLYNAAR